jgi:chromosome segregation ATPase
VSERNDLPARVAAIEGEVVQLRQDVAGTRDLAAHVDRDIADVHDVLKAHTRSLSALHQTQVEQGKEQVRQGRTLRSLAESMGGLIGQVRSQRQVLDEHTGILGEHGRVLAEHTVKLDEQGRVLAEHTVKLDEQGRVLAEHTVKRDEQSRVLADIAATVHRLAGDD